MLIKFFFLIKKRYEFCDMWKLSHDGMDLEKWLLSIIEKEKNSLKYF